MSAVNEMDDAALIGRYAGQGDRDALEELFRRHADMAYRTAVRFLRNSSEAEDAVQIAFVRIMRTAGDYRGGQGVGAWIAKMVVGTCCNMVRESVRRRNREHKAFQDQPHMTAVGDAGAELEEAVKQALADLPENHRAPVWMHHYEGKPFSEVARELGIPEGTARVHASRGMETLRETLAKGGRAVTVVAIVAAIPPGTVDSAPAALLKRLNLLSHGSAALSAGKIAVIVVSAAVLAGGVAVVMLPDRTAVKPAKDLPAITPSVPKDRFYRKWTFADKEKANELKVLEGAWHWDAGADGKGVMVRNSGVDSVLFLLPEDVPLRPLVLKVVGFVSEGATFGAAYANGDSMLPYRKWHVKNAILRRGGSQYDESVYLLERHIICFLTDKEFSGIIQLQGTQSASRVVVQITNMRLREIELQEIDPATAETYSRMAEAKIQEWTAKGLKCIEFPAQRLDGLSTDLKR